MGRTRLDLSNENTLKRLKKAGRGTGDGPGYKAGLTVMDVPSTGNGTRMTSWKASSGRVMQFHSDLERDFFLTLEWDHRVICCREQYVLELADTRRIAEEFGYKHPTNPETQMPEAMTTDMLATYLVDGIARDEAFAVKPMVEVDIDATKRPRHVNRIWEKLMIERAYWQGQGIRWRVVTEEGFDRVLARNVLKVHGYFHLGQLYPLTPEDVERIHGELFPRVAAAVDTLSNLALCCDKELRYEPGSSLKVARHLIATKRWPVDFKVPFDVCETLILKAEEL